MRVWTIKKATNQVSLLESRDIDGCNITMISTSFLHHSDVGCSFNIAKKYILVIQSFYILWVEFVDAI